MAIRIREHEGRLIAVCAAETDPHEGDIYLDDNQHYALAAKFAHDWQGQTVDWRYPAEWWRMDRVKVRDAEEELAKHYATPSEQQGE